MNNQVLSQLSIILEMLSFFMLTPRFVGIKNLERVENVIVWVTMKFFGRILGSLFPSDRANRDTVGGCVGDVILLFVGIIMLPKISEWFNNIGIETSEFIFYIAIEGSTGVLINIILAVIGLLVALFIGGIISIIITVPLALISVIVRRMEDDSQIIERWSAVGLIFLFISKAMQYHATNLPV